MKRYLILAGLILTLIIIASGVYAVYQSKYQTSYDTIDPDTGLVMIVNGVSSGEKQNDFIINGGVFLKNKGISSAQYNSLFTILKIATPGYKEVSVNARSVTYDNATKTYTFKLRLGPIGSTKYIFVTMKIVNESTFDIKIIDNEKKTIKEESSVKI